MFSGWTTDITMALYNFIHNDIQLKTLRWIQQQKNKQRNQMGKNVPLRFKQ